MITFPPAKINLGLNVIEKRPDNFHNIETVFYPVLWCDILEIVKADNFKFISTGLIVVGSESDNLCVKAYQLLKQDFNLDPVHIYLHKVIPMGAGLGGGSSDAAHTLSLLNEIFLLNLTTEQLADYAIQLGSDCAFFLHSQPMLASGRGEVLSEINVQLKDYFICIVMPPVQVSTAAAYSLIIPHQPDYHLNDIVMQPLGKWKEELKNDFEDPVFVANPIIKRIKEEMYLHGAVYSSMSGSGAAVFGLFDKRVNLQDSLKDCIVWQGKL